MQPIQRAEPLVNQVYKYLRTAILSASIPAGERIVETHIAAALKVSRSPVREAIRLLLTEQLLSDRDGEICVFEPTLKDYFELYDLRLALEPMVARQAAEKAHGADLTGLEDNLKSTERCLEALDVERLIQLNSEFHQFIRTISDNTRSASILESVSPVLEYYGRIVLNINKYQTNILEEHTGIYESIKGGDGKGAEIRMRLHVTKDLDAVKSAQDVILESGGLKR